MRERLIIQGVVPRQPLLRQFSTVEADIPHHPRHDVVVENVRRRADRRPLHRERKLSKHGRETLPRVVAVAVRTCGTSIGPE